MAKAPGSSGFLRGVSTQGGRQAADVRSSAENVTVKRILLLHERIMRVIDQECLLR
jgi:hypothetical protein